ncbi:MAG: Rrf2 family transcriptional regulator [Bacteroidia bacterium]|nr:MAG: Rrf2 family transcriptional regulator [Bacteroidia bacterium]
MTSSKLVHVSEAASIAIHSMALIAKEGTRLNAKQIAESTHSNRNHLAKVIRRLVKAGFISSERGPMGGFILSRPKEEITLLDIYEAIEGQLIPSTCGIERGECPFERCVFNHLQEELSATFKDYLSSTTVADIA